MNGRNPQRVENEDHGMKVPEDEDGIETPFAKAMQENLFGTAWPTMKTPSHLGHEHTKRVELRNAKDLGGCINSEIWCPVCQLHIGTSSVRTDL